MTIDCYYDHNGCYVCPEQPAEPAVPAHVEKSVAMGWGAGANSILVLDGPLRVRFNPSDASGAVIGLRSGRRATGMIAAIEHGVYVRRAAGAYVACVVERGHAMTEPRFVQDDDELELRRAHGTVMAYINGAPWFVSATPSNGPKVVGGCLYTSGDALPEGEAAATTASPTPPPANGDVKLVMGQAVSADRVGKDGEGTPLDRDPGWYIDVPEGTPNVMFTLTVPSGNSSDPWMFVNEGSRPTGDVNTSVGEALDGFTYQGAASDGVPNAGPVDFALWFDEPTPGRWYVVLDYVGTPKGYSLLARIATGP